MRIPNERESEVLYDFLILFQEDLVAGQVAPVESYVRRFPSVEQEVREEYRRALNPVPPSSIDMLVTRRIGSYRLIRRLGRGGQGDVFLAKDDALGREVALKVLSSPLGSVSPDRRARFRREAQLIAQLDHPAICSIYEAKLDAETPFLAMALVEGQSVAEWIAKGRAPRGKVLGLPCLPANEEELQRLLGYFEAAALALHVAHEAGIVHRDVKPGNLMVTDDGQPVLVDFGLALGNDSQVETLTRTGEIFGTPFYMAPEQLEPGRKSIDARADVYALAATLYETLTLSPPFEGDGWPALYRAIQYEPVPDARLANPIVPAALHAILCTAMDKDPGRRYATAKEFAEDLARAREHASVVGRVPSTALRFARLLQRSPLVTSGLVVLFVATLIGGGWWSNWREATAAADRRLLSNHFQEAARETSKRSTALALRHAYRASSEVPNSANDFLLKTLDELWEAKRHRRTLISTRAFEVLEKHGVGLTAGSRGELEFWNTSDGELIVERPIRNESAIVDATFHPGGDWAASTSSDGSVQLWKVRSTDPPDVLGTHLASAGPCAFDPEGTYLATAGEDARVRLWDLKRREQEGLLEHDESRVTHLAFAPSGKWLVTATLTTTDATRLYLWDMNSRASHGSWLAHSKALTQLEFSKDARQFISSSEDGSVRLWDAEEPGELVGVLEHGASVRQFEADESGRRLIVAHDANSLGHAVTIWNLESREAAQRFALEPTSGAVEARWGAGGEQVGVLASDHSLQLFDPATGKLQRRMLGHVRGAVGFRFVPSTDRIVSASTACFVHFWYATTRPFLQRLDLRAGPISELAFDESGEYLRVGHRGGHASWVRWPGVTRLSTAPDASMAPREIEDFSTWTSDVVAARTLSNGTHIRVLGQGYNRLERTKPETGHVERLPLEWTPKRAYISAAGHVVLVGPGNQSIRFYAPSRSEPTAFADDSPDAFTKVSFSSDGRRVASVSPDGTVKLWSLDKGTRIFSCDNPGLIETIVHSPDDRFLVVGHADGTIKVWPTDLDACALAANPWPDALLMKMDRELELSEIRKHQ